MVQTRESNFDLLRVLSTLAVVILHVSGGFLQYDEMKIPTNCHFAVMILNHIVRFAVPCFFMLSGAFILSDDRNADYKYFYKKTFKNIGITGLLFCLLYTLYRIAKLVLSVYVFKKYSISHFFTGLYSALKGLLVGDGNLWYLYTLVGLYFAAPFVIRLAADLRGGVNIYGNFTVVFLMLASISYITSEHELNWDIGWQLYFLSYFLMGYKLRQWGKVRKSNHTALLLIFSGIAINAILAYINYLRGLKELPVDVMQYYKNPFSYAPLAPIEVIASCMIFAGFSVLDVKKDFSKLAGHTFLIYLLHAGILEVISTVLGDRMIGNQLVEALSVFIISTTVFLLSLLGAMLYRKLSPFERMMQKRYKLE